MKRSMLLLTLAAGVFLWLGAACGDDGGGELRPLSLGDYLSLVDSILTDGRDGADAIQADFDAELESVQTIDEAVSAFEGALDAFIDLTEETASDLAAITPPEEAADAHAELRSVFDSGLEALEGLRDDLGGVETEEDFLNLGFESQFSSLEAESDAACFELQAVADENEIDVDLGCGEE